MKGCLLKNADEARLLELAGANLLALEKLIDYNIKNGIRMFRVSSDLIPFGSSMAAALPWEKAHADILSAISQKIAVSGMRISMHPGQYTVLNSPDGQVYSRAVEDLRYHAKVLDSLGAGAEGKIILHIGGVYGDKTSAKARFADRCQDLEPRVLARLALENDDKLFDIGDVLEICEKTRLPCVYDNLHNALNPADETRGDGEWVRLARATWKGADGRQKIHYSQQNKEKKPGSHSETIGIDGFFSFLEAISGSDADIMLEVKDKNLSAIKCILCIQNMGIGALETEWGRYKYRVLERSPEMYLEIKNLLKDKTAYPAIKMYSMIEQALALPIQAGSAVNAAQHVWGYFKEKGSKAEKKRFENALRKFVSGEKGILTVKNTLKTLADKYGDDYLLNSYYFSG